MVAGMLAGRAGDAGGGGGGDRAALVSSTCAVKAVEAAERLVDRSQDSWGGRGAAIGKPLGLDEAADKSLFGA